MKRFWSLVICLITTLALFASCANPDNESSSSSSMEVSYESFESSEISGLIEYVYDTTPRDIDFSVKYLGVGLEYTEENRKIAIFRNDNALRDTITLSTLEEAQAFTELIESYYVEYYNEFLESLGDEFFETKMLIINDCTQSSSAYTMAVRSVRVDENGVTVNFVYDVAEFGNDVLVNDLLLVTVDKRDVYGHDSFKTRVSLTPFDTTERELDFKNYEFDGKLDLNYYGMRKNAPYGDEISSLIQLKYYANSSESQEFIDFADGLDEEYFRNHILLLTYIEATDDDNEFEVVGVYNNERGTAIKITRNIVEDGNGEINRIILTEVDFTSVFGAQSIYYAVADGDEWTEKQLMKIYFDDKLIDGAFCEVNTISGEIMVPVVKTLEGMGAKVSWSSETKASVSIDGYTYTLDLKKKTMRRAGEDRFWGNVEGRIALDKELMVTSNDIFGLIIIDLHYNYNFDTHSLCYYIKTRDND